MGNCSTSSHIYTVVYKIKGDKDKMPQKTIKVGMYLKSGDRVHCACSHSIPKFQQVVGTLMQDDTPSKSPSPPPLPSPHFLEERAVR